MLITSRGNAPKIEKATLVATIITVIVMAAVGFAFDLVGCKVMGIIENRTAKAQS